MCGSVPGRTTASKSSNRSGRTDKRGQFLFAVDGSEQSPDDLFARAQSAEEMGDIVRSRAALPPSDEKRSSGCIGAVQSRKYAPGQRLVMSKPKPHSGAATRIDPTFAQAWYNLGDLLDDQGRTDAAIECLRKALRVAPDYADAMFNLALLLQRKNQYAEAADYWRRYLASDSHSDWATRARRSLKFCEMQGSRTY